MRDVFFSYKRNEPFYTERVRLIYHLLQRSTTLSFFLDELVIPDGRNWKEFLDQSLLHCRSGLVFYTPLSRQSEPVKYEATILAQQNKLLPVCLDDRDPPPPFNELQAVKLDDWDGNGEPAKLSRLIAFIERESHAPRVKQQSVTVSADSLASQTGMQLARLSPSRPMPSLHEGLLSPAEDLPVLVAINPAEIAATGSDVPEWVSQPGLRIPPFYISAAPITVREWNHAAQSGARHLREIPSGAEIADRPVTDVSWEEARNYTAWLNLRTGSLDYDLPTETQWEAAALLCTAKAPTAEDSAFAEKNYPPSVNSLPTCERTGLLPMTGLVWQWLRDGFVDPRPTATAHRPADRTAAKAISYTMKGGCWQSIERNRQIRKRQSMPRATRSPDVGFRVCKRD